MLVQGITYLTAHKGSLRELRRCIYSIYKDHESSKIPYEHLVYIDENISNSTRLHELHRIKEFASRVKYFGMKKNIGKAAAVNSLLREINYDHVALIDSDDWQFSGRSESIVKMHEDREINVAGSSYYTGDWRLNICQACEYPLSDADIRSKFIFYPYLLYSSLSFKSKFLKEENLTFNEKLNAGIDYEFYSRLLCKTQVANDSRKQIFYTISPGGITRQKVTRQNQLKVHAQTIEKILSNSTEDQVSMHEIAQVIVSSITSGEHKANINDKPSNIIKSIECLKSSWVGSIKDEFISKLPTEYRKRLILMIEKVVANRI